MGAFRRQPRTIGGAHPPPTSALPWRGPGPGKGAGCAAFPLLPGAGLISAASSGRLLSGTSSSETELILR